MLDECDSALLSSMQSDNKLVNDIVFVIGGIKLSVNDSPFLLVLPSDNLVGNSVLLQPTQSTASGHNCPGNTTKALIEITINMSVNLAAERLHREKVQHENAHFVAENKGL
jgi:hypothetical protein